MAFKKKGSHRNLIIAIALVAVVAIAAVAAAIYVNHVSGQSSANTGANLVGVQVGDTFTYNITGSCSASVPSDYYPGFYELNQTQYYKVAVTGIEGSVVSLQTDWVFMNGTDISGQQTIDLSNGLMSNDGGFWGLYPTNLKVGDSIYPDMNESVPVNATLTQPYASGSRQSLYYYVDTTQAYALDPTQSTERYLYDQIWFDKQTGMLTNFSEIQEYNSPEIELEVIYTLISSTVWNV